MLNLVSAPCAFAGIASFRGVVFYDYSVAEAISSAFHFPHAPLHNRVCPKEDD